MKFSLVPLLITGQTISNEIRQALRENHLQEAAAIMIQQYGLSCVEVGQLLDLSASMTKCVVMGAERTYLSRPYRAAFLAAGGRKEKK